MSRTVKLRVEKPAEVLSSGLFGVGALYRIERSIDNGLTYSEVTTGAIVSTTTAYSYQDLTGIEGYKYRARYSKATPVLSTDYSDYGNVVAA